ncbi:MAG: hypothetical protein HRT72_05395, partial [Flavobacteriales bacterium]|nr:hypothetical protein [Flavobacteriales bacterium]
VKYLNKVSLNSKFDIDIDMVNSKYTFNENTLSVNELEFGFDGWLAMPGDDIDMDLSFEAKQTQFKHILSLVPAVYAKDFEDIETSGKVAISGTAKGAYGESYPAFDVNMTVEDAMFKYPDLPKSAKNIQIAMNISNPGGSDDNTIIDLSKFHIDLGGNPFDMNLYVSTPVSDPNMKGGVNGTIYLDQLQDVIPMEEGESYSGEIVSDINFDGKLSSIEKERYHEFDASGNMIIMDMNYKSADFPEGVQIEKMDFAFSAEFLELKDFRVVVGNSDVRANGTIQNHMAYAFKENETLKGNFEMTSRVFDLNEMMGEEEVGDSEVDEEPYEVIEVPENIDFVLNAKLGKVLYDDIDITNIDGRIVVRNQKITMKNVDMNLMKGSMILNGFYETKDVKAPTINFRMNIKDFDVHECADKLNTVEKMAPIAKSMEGTFDCKMAVVGTLDKQMEPIYETLTGSGRMQTHEIELKNFKPLDAVMKAADKFKMDPINFSDIKLSFKFVDGRVNVNPFTVPIGKSTVVIEGSNGFDETIDYLMQFKIAKSQLGGQANAAMNSLLGQASGVGLNISTGDYIKMNVNVGGTVSNPEIKKGFGESEDGSGGVKEALKDKAKEELDKAKEEMKRKAKMEADKLKRQAEAKLRQEAEKARQDLKEKGKLEAKKELERLKKEGLQKAKESAKEDVKEQAKDALKGLFGKPK